MNIKRLLNKKGWTGAELGIIELTNTALIFKQAMEGKEPKPLIPASEFQRMIDNLRDPVQLKAYNNYIAVHEWIAVQFNTMQTHMQQAQLQYRTLEGIISTALLSENIYQYKERLPIIVTQKQYDDMKAEKVEEYLKDENGNDLWSDIFSLIEDAVDFYLDKLQSEPTKANPLKAIRETYISQPVRSRLILERYNEMTGRGYYTLKDGRRSDQMTAEEWAKALDAKEIKLLLLRAKSTDGKGRVCTFDEALQRLKNQERILFSSVRFSTLLEWHAYTEPSANLTKWDVIEQKLLLEIYPASFDEEDPYTKSSFTKSMEDFKAEFPELVAAMLEDMNKKYFKDDEIQISNLSLEEWGTTAISWRRKYELDFYGMKAKVENDANIFSYKKSVLNGIAIVRPNNLTNKCRSIDARGYFIEPKVEKYSLLRSLESFFTESENYAQSVEIVEASKDAFLTSYYFLLSYNYVLERMAAIYAVPELTVFKAQIDAIGDRIDVYNDATPLLYSLVKDTEYDDKELQRKKLQVIDDYFQPIKYKELSIPADRKEQINELLEDFDNFKRNSSTLYSLLINRPQSTGKGA